METNAILTLKRRGDGYDQTTGRRKAVTQKTILRDVPCVFTQPKSSGRRSYSDGIRDSVKPVYSLLIPDQHCAPAASYEIAPGDQATVTIKIGRDTNERTFTVNDAILAAGYTEAHWECTIEDVKVPIA